MTTHHARPVQLLRGLAALATLALIVAGTPWLLLTVAPLPLPDGPPALDEITTLLTSRDDGTLFLRATALIAWAAWALFTLGVLVESAAQVGGRQAPRLPGMGSLQRSAAKLVAAVLVAFGIGAPAAMAATPPAATATHHAPAAPPAAPAAQPGGRPAAEPSQEAHTRIVERGDTLWGIADDEYGEGERYRTIFKASKDIDQPKGIPRLTDPDLIYPGERLVIPKTGKPADPAPPAEKPDKPPHVERPSAPPTSESPTPAPSPPPATSTPAPERGAVQQPPTARPSTPPPATPVPSPPTARPSASPPATPAPSPPSPSPSETPDRGAARATPPATPAPSQSAGAGAVGGATLSPSSPSPETAPKGPASHVPDDEDAAVSTRTVLGYSALAAAGLLGLLALKRLMQQRRRRPGQRIRVPETMSDSEMDMRIHHEPASVELLDIALRSLSLRLGQTGGTLPALRGAHVTGETLELQLTEPAAPQPPFVAGSTDRVWTLDRTSEALLEPDDLQDIPSPYPALVTLGFDDARNHVLLDLESVGAITLTGSSGHIQEVLSALALEMAISPWADHIVITCVAFGKELPRVLGTGRLRYAGTVDEALRDFEARAQEVGEALADAHIGSVRQARTEQVADDTWTPQVILSLTPFEAEEIIRLRALIERDPPANLAVVIAAGDDGDLLPGCPRVDATPGRTTDVAPFGPVTVQRIAPDQYEQLVSDLGTANDECGVPDPDWHNVPPEPGDVRVAGRGDESLIDRDAPAPAEAVADLDPDAPEIRILGRVEIAGRDVGDIEPGKRNLLPELAAYLHLNPGRSPEEVSRALGGPRGPWSRSTRASNMSRLRAWFGRDGQGNVYVPTQGQGQLYTLTGVRCDWDRFQTLAKRGLAHLNGSDRERGIADLRAALALVRGQPFAGAGPTSYVWAEHLKQEMISAIVDVAHALGITLTDMGDGPGARAVIARGLDIEPGSELLFRDLIRAEHRAGNSAGIDHATERLLRNLHDLGLEMEPETADLLTRLRLGSPRDVSA